MSNFKLCYIRKPWAYFTTQDLDDQRGDDWNDAPYQHNAGRPYEPRDDRDEDWEIEKIAFSGLLQPPAESYLNKHLSVQDMNNGVYPWLQTPDFSEYTVKVWAGESIQDVINAVQAADGEVYTRLDMEVDRTHNHVIQEALDALERSSRILERVQQ